MSLRRFSSSYLAVAFALTSFIWTILLNYFKKQQCQWMMKREMNCDKQMSFVHYKTLLSPCHLPTLLLLKLNQLYLRSNSEKNVTHHYIHITHFLINGRMIIFKFRYKVEYMWYEVEDRQHVATVARHSPQKFE